MFNVFQRTYFHVFTKNGKLCLKRCALCELFSGSSFVILQFKSVMKIQLCCFLIMKMDCLRNLKR